MDEAVKRLSACLSACLLLAGAAPAAAQALQDPTRPPASLMAGGSGAAAGAVPAAPSAPRLQSVLIARQPGGRHVAVVDGETLRVGDSFKGARVTRIEQNEVELRRGSARQVLKLNAGAPTGAGAIERVRDQ